MTFRLLALVFMTSGLVSVHSFVPTRFRAWAAPALATRCEVALHATGDVNKKKKRRRKQTSPDSVAPSNPEEQDEGMEDDEMAMLTEIANFKFEADNAITRGIQGKEGADGDYDPLVLPDIKDQLRKKEMEEELARQEQEQKKSVKKIKRSDIAAFTKLLESEPFGDADDSFFEEEEYGTVSALLGERAKSFIGIPPGPLQVGHFIGALGIVLMAFIQYPGFPLTNLPTPFRDCLQGGLGTVYAINIVLAVIATFKAGERGQSKALWAIKTFAVGGLAYDQLTQLPTLEDTEAAKSQKGKRSIKKR